ncbi:hypothetical protein LJC42_05455 [Eubacteriales bacterium OttesenSCG-928-K08]|nr:hypothetical protein [Eubacteriales bacterium OttesenSCG-928-K08]
MNKGMLSVRLLFSGVAPAINANITINGENVWADQKHELSFDPNGGVPPVELKTPPPELSLLRGSQAPPYSTYTITVQAEGFIATRITGVQLYPGIHSLMPVRMIPIDEKPNAGNFGGYPLTNGAVELNIPEPAVRISTPRLEPGPGREEDEALLYGEAKQSDQSVHIPETIVVHLAGPNESARNIRIPFREYVKNVACSEIYPTWPASAIYANIHAQVGFALNRIYTNWYRVRGFAFDVTSSPVFDPAFVEGRNFFENINRAVDEVFNIYPRRKGHYNPLFSSYCNGESSMCTGLLQWGSVELAKREFTPLHILQYYYGDDVELAFAKYANSNAGAEALRHFQGLYGLARTGVVDQHTQDILMLVWKNMY